MITYETIYNLNQIFSIIQNSEDNRSIKKEFLGYTTNVYSKRLLTIKNNPICSCCGLKVKLAKLESYDKNTSPHINFYGEESFNNLIEDVLFTRDHINPISISKDDSLENSRTLCYTCNWIKYDKMINDDELLSFRNKYSEFRNKGLKSKESFAMIHRLINES